VVVPNVSWSQNRTKFVVFGPDRLYHPTGTTPQALLQGGMHERIATARNE